MISIYVLYVMLFPVAALWNMKVNHDKTQENLLSRNDTMYLRGVAACFVLLGHFCIWLNESAVVMNREFYFIYKQLGGIGVLIFFFVSGYGIYESYANRSPTYGYLIKRGGGSIFSLSHH